MQSAQFFLHGLDSSSKGTKGKWFAEHYPHMIIPDFEGSLRERLEQLERICGKRESLVFVGSSFGGLMATAYAISHENQCAQLILLAPALNFPDFFPPKEMIATPTRLIIGEHDTITPPDKVLPLAKQTFQNLEIVLCNDDHLLHKVFYELDWRDMLKDENL